MDKDEKKFSGGRRYRNDDITVYWKPSACVHASYCYRELIEVFDPSRRPWVEMNGSTTERIIEVVNLCPTEALAWTVKIMTDGPIIIKGNFTLAYSGNKKEVKDSLVSICRCGISDHQPFCDGQHRKIGFNG